MRIEKRDVDSIIVKDRLRQDLGDLTELMESITRLGLLHPIVILEDGSLIAGERRLRAHQKLALPQIDSHVWPQDTPAEDILAAEYDENETRRQMSAADKERYFQRLLPAELEKVREKKDSDPKFSDALVGTGVAQETENQLAKKLGTNRTAISSTRKLREVAENPADPAHEIAKTEYEKLEQLGRGSDRAWRKVQRAQRAAVIQKQQQLDQTRATLLPGQKLREDVSPKTQPRQFTNWVDRLWDGIGVSNLNPPMINQMAEDLDRAGSSVKVDGAAEMIELLNNQIEARRNLREVLARHASKKSERKNK